MKKNQWRIVWIVCGALSIVCAALNPYVGWYAAGNVAVLCSGFYVVSEASKRTKRLMHNRQLLKKMSKHDKDKFVSLDRQETKNIQAMLNMMLPIITVCNICLNIYCYVYYSMAHRIIFSPMRVLADKAVVCIILLVLDALGALGFWTALRKDVDWIMRLPETLYPKRKVS